LSPLPIHVLSVVPRMILPAQSGGELRILSLLRRLKGRFRFSLLAPTSEDRRASDEDAARALEREGVCEVHLASREAAPKAPPPLYPDSAKGLCDGNLGRTLLRLVLREDIPIVHFEFTEMAQYAEGVRSLTRVVLTEHDASVLSPCRYYVPERGAWNRASGWLRRVAYERSVLRHCRRVIALSEADAARLGRWASPDKLLTIPQGVSLDEFPFRGLEGREPDTIVFVGYFGHHPNEEAAVELARGILPLVRRGRPRARLRLVGSSPTPAVLSLRSERVEVTGPVPRVQPFLEKARVFAAPLSAGYGSKTKVLEAFASGVPVVASPLACEGLPGAEDGKHLLVGRGPAELARLAAGLLADAERSRRLAENARAYVERGWDWGARAEALGRLYEEVHARPLEEGP
jgi:glycosyltransferase involved in cell wall biosynthesis